MFCNNCGTKINTESNICPNCGKSSKQQLSKRFLYLLFGVVAFFFVISYCGKSKSKKGLSKSDSKFDVETVKELLSQTPFNCQFEYKKGPVFDNVQFGYFRSNLGNDRNIEFYFNTETNQVKEVHFFYGVNSSNPQISEVELIFTFLELFNKNASSYFRNRYVEIINNEQFLLELEPYSENETTYSLYHNLFSARGALEKYPDEILDSHNLYFDIKITTH